MKNRLIMRCLALVVVLWTTLPFSSQAAWGETTKDWTFEIGGKSYGIYELTLYNMGDGHVVDVEWHIVVAGKEMDDGDDMSRVVAWTGLAVTILIICIASNFRQKRHRLKLKAAAVA